mmetsp:Transcript_17791/g.31141  ORF Transcript_17791/g.31141 Transcript_17791/m.31141 type:complete len:100 (+) Transcript_17791:63-362(+)
MCFSESLSRAQASSLSFYAVTLAGLSPSEARYDDKCFLQAHWCHISSHKSFRTFRWAIASAFSCKARQQHEKNQVKDKSWCNTSMPVFSDVAPFQPVSK